MSVPDGADAYVIKRIIHNWNDQSSIDILRNCRNAMAKDGRVLVIDAIIEEDGKYSFNKLADLLMLAAVDEARGAIVRTSSCSTPGLDCRSRGSSRPRR